MSTLSFVVFAGDGGVGPYAVPFSSLDPSHIGVKVDGASVAFTWATAASILLDSPASSGAVIEIRRSTPREPLVDFTDGAILTEKDLDAAALQQIYIAQEVTDLVENSVTLGADGHFTASDRRISDLAAPVSADDAATKAYVDALTGADHAAAAEAAQSAAEAAEIGAEASRVAAEAAAAGLPTAPFVAADIADGAVTFAKLQDAAGAGYVGAGGAGDFAERSLTDLRADVFSTGIAAASPDLADAVFLSDADDGDAPKRATIAEVLALAGGKTFAAPVPTVSGSAVTFLSGLPAVSEIDIALDSVSLSGSDRMLIQLGTSGGIATSGYNSDCWLHSTSHSHSTAGFIIRSTAAGFQNSGVLRLVHQGANVWVLAGATSDGDASGNVYSCAGRVALSGACTQLRIIPAGTNTFDGGSIMGAYA